MKMDETWGDWFERITNGAGSRPIGQRVGRSHTTVQNWKKGHRKAEAAILISLAYDADLLEALVAAGVLSSGDVDRASLKATVRRVPGVTLTAELHRRELERSRR